LRKERRFSENPPEKELNQKKEEKKADNIFEFWIPVRLH